MTPFYLGPHFSFDRTKVFPSMTFFSSFWQISAPSVNNKCYRQLLINLAAPRKTIGESESRKKKHRIKLSQSSFLGRKRMRIWKMHPFTAHNKCPLESLHQFQQNLVIRKLKDHGREKQEKWLNNSLRKSTTGSMLRLMTQHDNYWPSVRKNE